MTNNSTLPTLTSIPLESIEVGMNASYTQIIIDENIRDFANISGDHNPVHLDESFAQTTRFKKRIAHGLMSASFFSQLFGTKLPGIGCVYTAQSLKFLRPVYIGDAVTATIEVLRVDLDRRRITFKTTCVANDKLVIDGEAEIYVPKNEK